MEAILSLAFHFQANPVPSDNKEKAGKKRASGDGEVSLLKDKHLIPGISLMFSFLFQALDGSDCIDPLIDWLIFDLMLNGWLLFYWLTVD